MVKEGSYIIDNFYQGGYSSLSPSYGDLFTGYHVDAGSLGVTTDPRTANILKDTSTKLAGGSKQIELALVSPEIFDSIPKQHLQEVHRLSKLTGTEVSVHGPVMDVAGYDRQGHFSEVNRESAERRIADIVMRSHEVDPSGNIPVTFHSAEGIPGTEWETFGKDRKAKRIIAVSRDTGQMVPIEKEMRYHPGEDLSKVKPSPPEEELKVANDSQWVNQISPLIFNKERADEILQQNQMQIDHVLDGLNKGTIRKEEVMQNPTYRQALSHYNTAKSYLDDINKNINALFSKAYKYGTPDQQKKLQEVSDNFKKEVEKNGSNPMAYSQAMQELLTDLQRRDLIPKMYVPIEEFAVTQSSKTFGNAAFEAFKKFGTKAPVISIENPPAGFALSTGEDLKNLVEASREQFIQKAVESGKLSESEAREQAEKLIGATWDVGHINMLRKQGASEKELIKETEKIAPFVKHIHLSDNFGFEHTEIPMGMGNVPLKEMLEKLPEKDIKKVIEAGQWWQHFQTNPLKESFEGLGSPIYPGGPLWNQAAGLQQGYFSGYGMMLPSVNYNFWGSGFSMASLPTELGGQMPGQGGRMSGTPME